MYFLQEDGLAEDPTSLDIEAIGKAVDKIEGRINEIEKEIDGVEKVRQFCLCDWIFVLFSYLIFKGYIPVDRIEEACKGLHKRCVVCSEQLMQNTEKLDTIVSRK